MPKRTSKLTFEKKNAAPLFIDELHSLAHEAGLDGRSAILIAEDTIEKAVITLQYNIDETSNITITGIERNSSSENNFTDFLAVLNEDFAQLPEHSLPGSKVVYRPSVKYVLEITDEYSEEVGSVSLSGKKYLSINIESQDDIRSMLKYSLIKKALEFMHNKNELPNLLFCSFTNTAIQLMPNHPGRLALVYDFSHRVCKDKKLACLAVATIGTLGALATLAVSSQQFTNAPRVDL